MMDGFDILGADEGLANQYIVVRVKSIDRDKLASKIGGAKGQIASSALQIVNTTPKAILDAAVPIAVSQAKNYGIDADVVVTDVPPQMRARAYSEFWPGLLAGAVLGGLSLTIAKLIGKLVARR